MVSDLRPMHLLYGRQLPRFGLENGSPAKDSNILLATVVKDPIEEAEDAGEAREPEEERERAADSGHDPGDVVVEDLGLLPEAGSLVLEADL